MTSASEIRNWLVSRQPDLLGLLEHLVITESHAAHPAGVAAVAGMLIDRLGRLGFTFEEVVQTPPPEELAWLEELLSPGIPYHELGASYRGSRPGTLPGKLLLLGDLDTAFPVGTLERFPYRIEDGQAFGPGVADMKGGLVVLVAALESLDHFEFELPDIAVVLSGDEQAGSLGSRPVIEQAATGADWCLCVECARRGGKLMAARGHIGVGMLTVAGVEAHTGSARADGVNALEALARLIVAFNELSEPEDGTLITVTMAHAGRRRSIVPALATATVDIRTKSEERWSAVTTRLRQLADDVEQASGARVELRMYSHRPGFIRTAETEQLLEVTRRVGAELEISIDAFASAAAGSSAFRESSTVALDGLGPVGSDLMTFDEHIDVDSLLTRSALLAGLIGRLPALLDNPA